MLILLIFCKPMSEHEQQQAFQRLLEFARFYLLFLHLKSYLPRKER